MVDARTLGEEAEATASDICIAPENGHQFIAGFVSRCHMGMKRHDFCLVLWRQSIKGRL